MAGPGNDLQRLPLGFDSPRLHLFTADGQSLAGTPVGIPRPPAAAREPRQEYPVWQAQIIETAGPKL